MGGVGNLYFAYGSNLSTMQMHNRCPLSTPVGLAHLTGFTWIINERGYANIVANEDPSSGYAPGIGVYGLVYQLHPDDEERLDVYEEVGSAYEKEMLQVMWADVSASAPAQDLPSLAAEAVPYPDTKLSMDGTETQHGGENVSVVAGELFEALVYIDPRRITPSTPKEEYVGRMNVGIEDASTRWGLPISYVNDVMRPYIPAPTE